MGISVLVLATITKYHRVGDLNSRYLFLTVLKAGSPSSRIHQVWFLVRALFLYGHQSSQIRAPPSWPHSTLITSCSLQLQSHGVAGGREVWLGLQHTNLGWTQFSPLHQSLDGHPLSLSRSLFGWTLLERTKILTPELQVLGLSPDFTRWSILGKLLNYKMRVILSPWGCYENYLRA